MSRGCNIGDGEVIRKCLSRMEVPLALFQHHQKESGFPAGGAQGGWRRSGGGTFIFLQDFDFKHLCDNWREGPTGKKPLTSRCCPDGKSQVLI